MFRKTETARKVFSTISDLGMKIVGETTIRYSWCLFPAVSSACNNGFDIVAARLMIFHLISVLKGEKKGRAYSTFSVFRNENWSQDEKQLAKRCASVKVGFSLSGCCTRTPSNTGRPRAPVHPFFLENGWTQIRSAKGSIW